MKAASDDRLYCTILLVGCHSAPVLLHQLGCQFLRRNKLLEQVRTSPVPAQYLNIVMFVGVWVCGCVGVWVLAIGAFWHSSLASALVHQSRPLFA